MSESKREEVRKYLDGGNVMETLNHAMIALQAMEPRPEKPMAFIREQLGAVPCEDVDELIRENQDLNARIIRLRQLIALAERRS
jgi:hypothetical protein